MCKLFIFFLLITCLRLIIYLIIYLFTMFIKCTEKKQYDKPTIVVLVSNLNYIGNLTYTCYVIKYCITYLFLLSICYILRKIPSYFFKGIRFKFLTRLLTYLTLDRCIFYNCHRSIYIYISLYMPTYVLQVLQCRYYENLCRYTYNDEFSLARSYKKRN